MAKFIKINSFILLFLFFLIGSSYSEVVKKVEVKGNVRIFKGDGDQDRPNI